MARARAARLPRGLGGAAEGRDPNAQPLQRPSRPPPASSVSRAGKLPHFHLGGAAPGAGRGEGPAPPPTAPPGLARTERSARAWTARGTAIRMLRVAGRRRALPAADPGRRGTPAAERGPRALAGNAGGRSHWATGAARPVQEQPGALEGTPGGLTPSLGDNSLKTTPQLRKTPRHFFSQLNAHYQALNTLL